jgi:hypothetical protein
VAGSSTAGGESSIDVTAVVPAPGEASSTPQADLKEKLRPVAIAAEDVAARAVDISARELKRLSEYLERRRQQRAESTSDDRPDSDSASTSP